MQFVPSSGRNLNINIEWWNKSGFPHIIFLKKDNKTLKKVPCEKGLVLSGGADDKVDRLRRLKKEYIYLHFIYLFCVKLTRDLPGGVPVGGGSPERLRLDHYGGHRAGVVRAGLQAAPLVEEVVGDWSFEISTFSRTKNNLEVWMIHKENKTNLLIQRVSLQEEV